MGNAAPDQLSSVSFRCKCGHRFSSTPGRVEDAADRTHHPWRYYADCPECEGEAGQAPWEIALMASYGKHTGPRSVEGKAAVAANLEGHPTSEETRRTRFNAMKHGLNSRVATYFPAKPGKYPHCDGCEYLYAGCYEQVACLRRSELFLRHQIAFETGDPKLLTDIRADTQAAVQAIVNDMILAISSTGVELKNPEWYYDQKSGAFSLVSFVNGRGETVYSEKVSAHPLLKVLTDFLSKNNMSLADLAMTPKQRDDDQIMQGYLDGQDDRQESALEYQKRSALALEGLTELIERSRARTARDPILIEHKSDDIDG